MKKTVLVVDDEISMRTILEHFLRPLYNVVVLQNGREALEWMEHNGEPACAIVDLLMPEVDGFQLIEQVRSHNHLARTPIVVLSSKESSTDRIKCLRMGADDYLVKPFNPEELLARMESIFRRMSMQS